MSEAISLTKQYKTRDGREVRLYATDGIGCNSIHGAIRFDSGWQSETWYPDGKRFKLFNESDLDLIEVKPVITGWMNVYRYQGNISTGGWCETKEHVDAVAVKEADRIACIKLQFTEGEGL